MRQIAAEHIVPGTVIRCDDGTHLNVMYNVMQENGRRKLHCLSNVGAEVWLDDVNPTLYFDVPVLPGDNVKLLKEGLHRVLDGEVGMSFLVYMVTNGVYGPVVHVLDYRRPDPMSYAKFTIWSIGHDGYEVEGG